MADENKEQEPLQVKLSNSEKKLRGFFEKRDGLNEEARFLRNERDSLNSRKREIIESIRKIRDKRTAEMEDLKRRRDEVTAPYRIQRDRLNAMVKVQKRKRKGYEESLSSHGEEEEGQRKKRSDPITEINMLNMEIQALMTTYETSSMSKKKEQETMDNIKALNIQVKELEKELPDYMREQMENEKKAIEKVEILEEHDMAHQDVMQLSQKAQEFHSIYIKENDKFKKELDSIYNKYQEEIENNERTLQHLSKEADKRHREFMAMRERADHFHKRAMDLRGTVLHLREERRALEQKLQGVIDEQNKAVKEALEDEGKIEEAADKALDLLKKGGKINL